MAEMKKLVFQAQGGPFDGQQLLLDPPFVPVAKPLVMPHPEHTGVFVNYVFSRLDWSAKYVGDVLPNQGMEVG